ncbi:MAG: DDE-type integrase/transposase/recombinase [Phycisphaerae bacterium]|nr:DDE-type integrase/transposase/recombinase [Phycisphaerae bacterium]
MALAARREIAVDPQRAALAGLSDEQRLEVGRKTRIVSEWKQMRCDLVRRGATRGEADRVFCGMHGVGRSKLHDWARLIEAGDVLGLVDGRRRANRDTRRESCSPEAWNLFKKFWLTRQQRTVALCCQLVAAEAERQGWAWPSLRTVQAKVRREISEFEANRYRLGEEEWDRKHGVRVPSRDYTEYRANQCWVGDFHIVDVFCRRSDADPEIIRPRLGAFIDLRSRIVTGWTIGETENQDAVLLTFRDGIEKWGPPAEVIIDNGKPYRAKGISGGRPTTKRLIEDEDYCRSVFGGVGSEVSFALPFNPDSKLIERWFGTLEGQYGATYETYCGGKKDARFQAAYRVAKAHPERCPTIARYRDGFTKYIDAYHRTPHRGVDMNGRAPIDVFNASNPIPRVVVPEGLMDLLLMRVSRPVKVTRFGVRHDGIEYGLGEARLQLLQGKEVLLRVHPEDASYVVVCDLEGKPICRATNNRLAFARASRDDIAKGMRAKKQARRLASAVQDGGTRAAMQTVTEAAIDARNRAAKRQREHDAMNGLIAATGTDDAAPTRTIRPLKSDWADAMCQFRVSGSEPAGCGTGPDEALTLDDLAGAIDAQRVERTDEAAVPLSFADLFRDTVEDEEEAKSWSQETASFPEADAG